MSQTDKQVLERQLERLKSKKKNLEIAVKELGEDAEESAVDWFEIELKKVDVQITQVQTQLDAIEVEDASAK